MLLQNLKVYDHPEHQNMFPPQVNTEHVTWYSPGGHYIDKKGTRRLHRDRSQSPPSPRNISFSGPSSSFPSFGRWTAHRAYVKKV